MPDIDPFSAALSGAGLVGGVIGAIGKIIGRGQANRQLARLQKSNPAYQANPLAAQRLALSQTLLNARMPGAAAAERNIYSNQANQIANINRGATDASQALALASGVGTATNQAFNNLGTNEAQDYERRYGNVEQAQQGQINEDNKVFEDKVRRWQDQAQIQGVQQQNRQANWGDVSNAGFALADFGLAGGFGNNRRANPAQYTSINPTQQQPMQWQGSINPQGLFRGW